MAANIEFYRALATLVRNSASGQVDEQDYAAPCEALGVSKLYYELNLDVIYRPTAPVSESRGGPASDGAPSGGPSGQPLGTSKGVPDAEEKTPTNRTIYAYDSGMPSASVRDYKYYYSGEEYVHCHCELGPDAPGGETGEYLLHTLADVCYLIGSRQTMREQLERARFIDPVTGCPNGAGTARKYFELTRTIHPEDLLVIRLNLQNFKYLNESCGSRCGDEAIVQYALKLRYLVDADECAGRLGGDNFVLIIKKENKEKFLSSIRYITISHLSSAPRRSFEVSSWIGISELAPGEDKPYERRLQDADMACDLGKTRLKHNVVTYDSKLDSMVNQGHEIVAAFLPALRNREFHAFYQPKVDMRTGELTGFEALSRWVHDGRLLFPDRFISILDRESLIPELDMAVFNEVCSHIRAWKDKGLKPPRISSNFSKKNLFVPNIEENILATLEHFGLDPEDVEIEITESIKETETGRLIDFVKNLKNHGLHISIDDFGTGYSSLSLLHNIDADVIKIDKSFIENLPTDHKSRVLIESIISISERLHMATIAEGVETVKQGIELMKLGCTTAQGYYYSKPVDFEAATEMIRNPRFSPMPLTE